MLMKSDIDPFDSQETKPYKNDPRIAAMTDIVGAYQQDDVHRYEAILQSNKDLLEDPFIAENIGEVTRNIRMKAVLKLVAPYTRFGLAFIAKRLNISVGEVQDIVGYLIVDGKLKGKIDQEQGTVEMEKLSNFHRISSISQWTSAVESMWVTILNEGDGFKAEENIHGFGIGMSAPPNVPSDVPQSFKEAAAAARGGSAGHARGRSNRRGGR